MRVYLDNCCFNRPFDDQSQTRVRLETEAKLEIQQRIRDGKIELAWSYMLEYENRANPFGERRSIVARWKAAACVDIGETAVVVEQARQLADRGIAPGDAIHVACAVAAGCDFLLTTDQSLTRKMAGFVGIAVVNPARFVIEVQ